MQEFQQIIEAAWEDRASLQPGTAPAKIGAAVSAVLAELDKAGCASPRRSKGNGSRING